MKSSLISWIFKARYMNGVGFKILTRTPVPKFSLSVFVNCVQLYSLLQVGLIMLNG